MVLYQPQNQDPRKMYADPARFLWGSYTDPAWILHANTIFRHYFLTLPTLPERGCKTLNIKRKLELL